MCVCLFTREPLLCVVMVTESRETNPLLFICWFCSHSGSEPVEKPCTVYTPVCTVYSGLYSILQYDQYILQSVQYILQYVQYLLQSVKYILQSVFSF